MIDNAKSMQEELSSNKMVKKDLKNIFGHITPYVPLIGLVCGVTIIGKHMYNKKNQPSPNLKKNKFFNPPTGYKTEL